MLQERTKDGFWFAASLSLSIENFKTWERGLSLGTSAVPDPEISHEPEEVLHRAPYADQDSDVLNSQTSRQVLHRATQTFRCDVRNLYRARAGSLLAIGRALDERGTMREPTESILGVLVLILIIGCLWCLAAMN